MPSKTVGTATNPATSGVFASLYVATQPRYYNPDTVRYFLQQAIQVEAMPLGDLENLYEEIRQTVNPAAASYAELTSQTAQEDWVGAEEAGTEEEDPLEPLKNLWVNVSVGLTPRYMNEAFLRMVIREAFSAGIDPAEVEQIYNKVRAAKNPQDLSSAS
jgi:hypothetical protein